MQKTVETIQNKILRGSELQEFAKQFNTKIQGDVKTKFDELGTASTKNAGNEAGQAWGCDLTYNYVRINATYRS